MALAAIGGRPMNERDTPVETAGTDAPVQEVDREAIAPAPENGAIHDDLLDGVAGGGGAWTRLFSGR